jgi:S-adenosylmethionine:tRNA ribosyltransferase-isomerase
VPIPPYLGRLDEPEDAARYQTVFARAVGSVAAPTAGLHLSEPLIERLRARGLTLSRLTLEIGLGTFRPVEADDLDQHPMHSETLEITEELAAEVAGARRRGAPVVAIGTTVVRALEATADPERPGEVRPFRGETRLLIQPGYSFRVVDALLTNFHQPKSTLLALVGAFAGLPRVLEAYAVAVSEGYRFLSYGDAMWLPGRA